MQNKNNKYIKDQLLSARIKCIKVRADFTR